MNYLSLLTEGMKYSPLLLTFFGDSEFVSFLVTFFDAIKDGHLSEDEIKDLVQSDFVKSLMGKMEDKIINHVKNM